MFVNKDSLQLITMAELSKLYPNTLFPAGGPDADLLEELNLAPLTYREPVCESTETVQMLNEAELVNGEYVQSYVTVPKSPEVLEQERVSAIEAEIANLESLVTERRKREALLSEAGRAWLQDIDDQISVLRAQR